MSLSIQQFLKGLTAWGFVAIVLWACGSVVMIYAGQVATSVSRLMEVSKENQQFEERYSRALAQSVSNEDAEGATVSASLISNSAAQAEDHLQVTVATLAASLADAGFTIQKEQPISVIEINALLSRHTRQVTFQGSSIELAQALNVLAGVKFATQEVSVTRVPRNSEQVRFTLHLLTYVPQGADNDIES